MSLPTSLSQKLFAEYLGSLVLVVAAISPPTLIYHALDGSVALAVFADGIVVGFVLFVLIGVLAALVATFTATFLFRTSGSSEKREMDQKTEYSKKRVN